MSENSDDLSAALFDILYPGVPAYAIVADGPKGQNSRIVDQRQMLQLPWEQRPSYTTWLPHHRFTEVEPSLRPQLLNRTDVVTNESQNGDPAWSRSAKNFPPQEKNPWLVLETDHLLVPAVESKLQEKCEELNCSPEHLKRLQAQVIAHALVQAGFPHHGLIDSGSKSVHIVIRFAEPVPFRAQSHPEHYRWHQLLERLHLVLGSVDFSVIHRVGNHGLTRFPGGCRRNGSQQPVTTQPVLSVRRDPITFESLWDFLESQLSPTCLRKIRNDPHTTVSDSGTLRNAIKSPRSLRNHPYSLPPTWSHLACAIVDKGGHGNTSVEVDGRADCYWRLNQDLAKAGQKAPRLIRTPAETAPHGYPYGQWDASFLWWVQGIAHHLLSGAFFSIDPGVFHAENRLNWPDDHTTRELVEERADFRQQQAAAYGRTAADDEILAIWEAQLEEEQATGLIHRPPRSAFTARRSDGTEVTLPVVFEFARGRDGEPDELTKPLERARFNTDIDTSKTLESYQRSHRNGRTAAARRQQAEQVAAGTAMLTPAGRSGAGGGGGNQQEFIAADYVPEVLGHFPHGLRYLPESRGGGKSPWWIFNKCWTNVSNEWIELVTAAVLTRNGVHTAKDRKVKLVLFELRCIPDILFDAEWIEQPYTMAFENGTLILNPRTGVPTFYPEHFKEHNLKVCLSYPYDPEQSCPQFEESMKLAFPESSDREAFLTFMASALVPDRLIKGIMILYGDKDAGKSTLFKMMEKVFGEEAMIRFDYSTLGEPHMTEPLVGKRIAYDAEAESPKFSYGGSLSRTGGLVKSMSGGDPIMINPKHARAYSVSITALLILSCNRIPKMSDVSSVLYERMIPVRCSKIPVEKRVEEKVLMQRIHDERSGVVNLLIQKLVGYIQDMVSGNASDTILFGSAMEERREMLRYESDHYYQFLSECFEPDLSADEDCTWYDPMLIYNTYRQFASNRGFQVGSMDTLVAHFEGFSGNLKTYPNLEVAHRPRRSRVPPERVQLPRGQSRNPQARWSCKLIKGITPYEPLDTNATPSFVPNTGERYPDLAPEDRGTMKDNTAIPFPNNRTRVR